jgi:hypothetical protein
MHVELDTATFRSFDQPIDDLIGPPDVFDEPAGVVAATEPDGDGPHDPAGRPGR